MSTPATHYQIIAHNYSFDSDNKIHSDDVAKEYGFKGGLVPGVADFAYLARATYDHWGEAWLSGGTIEAKFIKPVYHGETAFAAATPSDEPDTLTLALTNVDGVLCAAGSATLAGAGTAPSPAAFRSFPLPAEDARPAPDIATFPAGTQLGAYEYDFDASTATQEAVEKFVDAWPSTARWHPAIALHDANRILRANVALGPWIHTASKLDLFGAPVTGERVSLRGNVLNTFERRGHVMTELDLGVFAADRPIARVKHTAIIRLSGTA
jgi:acyl dehydratase